MREDQESLKKSYEDLKVSSEKLQDENTKQQASITALSSISTEQNRLIEELTAQLEAHKIRIKELEQDSDSLHKFKDHVCDSDQIDCVGANLPPET